MWGHLPAPTRCQGPTHRLRVHLPPGGSRAFLASVLSLTRIFWDHAVCHARGPWGRGQSRQSVTQGFYKQTKTPASDQHLPEATLSEDILVFWGVVLI